MPNVDIPPDLILPLLLPPLLYAAVRRTSWRQFAANVRPIFLLAVALVFVTTARSPPSPHAIVPGLPIAAAVALGALVAPPDPVAATAVAGQLGLPRRLVSILEGEGLFNDVTAIVLYHVASPPPSAERSRCRTPCSTWCCPPWSRSPSGLRSAGPPTG